MGVEEKVKEMLSEYSGLAVSEINGYDLIEFGLGLTGDDIFEFLEKYFEEFEVSHENFEFSDYFHDEWHTLNFPIIVVRNFFHIVTGKHYPRTIPVTVGDLIRAAKKGYWDM